MSAPSSVRTPWRHGRARITVEVDQEPGEPIRRFGEVVHALVAEISLAVPPTPPRTVCPGEDWSSTASQPLPSAAASEPRRLYSLFFSVVVPVLCLGCIGFIGYELHRAGLETGQVLLLTGLFLAWAIFSSIVQAKVLWRRS